MKEIVIKIDDNLYERIKNLKKLETIYCCTPLVEAIKNGTELPKGHDALVDRGEILKHEVFVKIGEEGYEDYAIPVDCLSEVQPIIEAELLINAKMAPTVKPKAHKIMVNGWENGHYVHYTAYDVSEFWGLS